MKNILFEFFTKNLLDILIDYFRKFGTIEEISLINRTKDSQYCFIVFKEKDKGLEIARRSHLILEGGDRVILELSLQKNHERLDQLEKHDQDFLNTSFMVFDSSNKSPFFDGPENIRFNYERLSSSKNLICSNNRIHPIKRRRNTRGDEVIGDKDQGDRLRKGNFG